MRVAVLICLLAFFDLAHASDRVALVIGNGRYESTSNLERTVESARRIASNLRARGFKVLDGYDLSRSEFLDIVEKFGELASSADVAVFSYTGHGLSFDSAGSDAYLLPVDVPPTRRYTRQTLQHEIIALGYIRGVLERSGPKLRVFIVDACKNDPFTSFERKPREGTAASDGVYPAGLNAVSPGAGEYIIFSTQDDQAALDNYGPDDQSDLTIFARSFLPEFKQGRLLPDALNAAKPNILKFSRLYKSESSFEPFEQLPLVHDNSYGPVCIDKSCAKLAPPVPALSPNLTTSNATEPAVSDKYLAIYRQGKWHGDTPPEFDGDFSALDLGRKYCSDTFADCGYGDHSDLRPNGHDFGEVGVALCGKDRQRYQVTFRGTSEIEYRKLFELESDLRKKVVQQTSEFAAVLAGERRAPVGDDLLKRMRNIASSGLFSGTEYCNS